MDSIYCRTATIGRKRMRWEPKMRWSDDIRKYAVLLWPKMAKNKPQKKGMATGYMNVVLLDWVFIPWFYVWPYFILNLSVLNQVTPGHKYKVV